jgi:hypothetical protein
MSFLRGLSTTAATLLLLAGTAPGYGQDASRPAAGGGISVPGWVGAVDADAKSEGQTIADTKLSKTGNILQVVTGPAASFWDPANKATGDYTVSATFTEAKYMNLNDHPHPYGIFIAGNDLGTDHETQVVTAEKLKSTDGIYGIRFAHNTEGTVSGFKMTRP